MAPRTNALKSSQVTTIWVQIGATEPTADYANLRPEAGAVLSIPEGATKEDVKKGFEELFSLCSEQIQGALDAIQEMKTDKK